MAICGELFRKRFLEDPLYSEVFYPKALLRAERKELFCISSLELLTKNFPDIDDRLLFEWLLDVFWNKFNTFAGALSLLI